jgi:hypothetical protein
LTDKRERESEACKKLGTSSQPKEEDMRQTNVDAASLRRSPLTTAKPQQQQQQQPAH